MREIHLPDGAPRGMRRAILTPTCTAAEAGAMKEMGYKVDMSHDEVDEMILKTIGENGKLV